MTQSENELVKVRLEKLERLRAKGIDPYPRNYERTHSTNEALSLFEAAEAKDGKEARTEDVSLAGRMVAFRGMGPHRR